MNQNSTHGQGINFSGVSNTLSTAQSCLPQVCRLVTLQPNTIYPHSVKPVLHWLELTELPLVTAIRHATSKPSNRGAGSEVSAYSYYDGAASHKQESCWNVPHLHRSIVCDKFVLHGLVPEAQLGQVLQQVMVYDLEWNQPGGRQDGDKLLRLSNGHQYTVMRSSTFPENCKRACYQLQPWTTVTEWSSLGDVSRVRYTHPPNNQVHHCMWWPSLVLVQRASDKCWSEKAWVWGYTHRYIDLKLSRQHSPSVNVAGIGFNWLIVP